MPPFGKSRDTGVLTLFLVLLCLGNSAWLDYSDSVSHNDAIFQWSRLQFGG